MWASDILLTGRQLLLSEKERKNRPYAPFFLSIQSIEMDRMNRIEKLNAEERNLSNIFVGK